MCDWKTEISIESSLVAIERENVNRCKRCELSDQLFKDGVGIHIYYGYFSKKIHFVIAECYYRKTR